MGKKSNQKFPTLILDLKLAKSNPRFPILILELKLAKSNRRFLILILEQKLTKSNPRFPILILAKSRENLAKNPKKVDKEGGHKEEDPKNLENLADGIDLFFSTKNGPLFNKSCDHENQILLRMFL